MIIEKLVIAVTAMLLLIKIFVTTDWSWWIVGLPALIYGGVVASILVLAVCITEQNGGWR